jgi:hypothetical protein
VPIVLTAALTGVLCGCASPRVAVDPESSLQRQLGFIRSDDTTRTYVQARLGEPVSSYESGRIVSYALYWRDNHFTLPDPAGSECFGLVIAYGDDDRIARYALVRMGSNRCRR